MEKIEKMIKTSYLPSVVHETREVGYTLIVTKSGELLEVKPDKMPIGIHFREKESFTNNKLEIKKIQEKLL